LAHQLLVAGFSDRSNLGERDLVAWISSMNAVIPGLLGFI
jgi:hypothetical protein